MSGVFISKTERPFPVWGKVLGVVLGLVLISYSTKTFFTLDIDQLKLTFPYALMGVICIVIAGYEKEVSISSEGISRIHRYWGRSGQTLFPWESVKTVFAKDYPGTVRVSIRIEKKKINADFPGVSSEELIDSIKNMSPSTEIKVL